MTDSKKGFVAQKIADLPFSGIRRFYDIADEIEGAISLGVGEPDFLTPWNIREEAIFRLERGGTSYTSNAGLPELRREIAAYIRKFGTEYDPKTQVLVTIGASEAIDVALRAVTEPGDEILIVEPCYVSYKACIIMAGGVPVVISPKPENDFRLLPEEITAKLTPRTKALIMGYPNNPTGAVMERADLERIAEVLREQDILVISDEIYAELTYGPVGREGLGDAEHASIAALPGMYGKTLVINGFSKAFAMTGWRLGYACGPAELISAMTKIHQYVLMCASRNSQYAGLEALRNSHKSVAAMRREYDARRRVLLDGFREIGLPCFEPRGAFYTFPSIQKTGLSSEEFCEKLLMSQKLAVVPGNAFGEAGEGFVRCSYAYSVESLKEALRRLKAFLRET
ncbi:MAG: aminotransferase class I/II-fold pyridoxal phosphate-dependent enzyme [Firmicutes bacterium]|nr:aminotransferase class I/II-fold pyridoxal phosphate-dependent enzyme [Bacillota bacterium]